MPNTLAHLGVQGLITRGVVAGADPKWIYLGAIIPDVPWILRRAVAALPIEVAPYDLMNYSTVQSALFMCLVLAVGLSSLSSRSRRVFAILVLGAVLHLLLDSLQTKWANGVSLFAPFSWTLLNFELFWPESTLTVLLSAFGLAFFLYAWRRFPADAGDLVWPRGRMLALGAASMAVYLFLPAAFLWSPQDADNHFVQTLRQRDARAGRAVEFDRAIYQHRPGGGTLTDFAGETFKTEGLVPARSGQVSVRGRFVGPNTVSIEDLHRHWPRIRDLLSYLGLAMLLLAWGRSLWPAVRRGIRRTAGD